MTPEEMSALSDEALNCLAAERGMGWNSAHTDVDGDLRWWDDVTGYFVADEGFFPCSDLNDAWMLAEKLREKTSCQASVYMYGGSIFGEISDKDHNDVAFSRGGNPARALTEAVMLAVLARKETP